MVSIMDGTSGKDRPSVVGTNGGSVSPLRQRMIQDMELAGLAQTTKQTYIRSVVALQKHYGIRPDKLSEKQVRDYFIWLREEKQVAKGTFQTQLYGLRFFFYSFLDYDWALFTKKKSACQSKSVSPCRFHAKSVAA